MYHELQLHPRSNPNTWIVQIKEMKMMQLNFFPCPKPTFISMLKSVLQLQSIIYEAWTRWIEGHIRVGHGFITDTAGHISGHGFITDTAGHMSDMCPTVPFLIFLNYVGYNMACRIRASSSRVNCRGIMTLGFLTVDRTTKASCNIWNPSSSWI